MTKDEADEKVAKASAEVLYVARKMVSPGEPWDIAVLRTVVGSLERAEVARAALDKPRLMTPEERADIGMADCREDFSSLGAKLACERAAKAIQADRADILAQAEKLSRHSVSVMETHQVTPGLVSGAYRARDAILLSDLRNLIKGT